MAAAPLQPITPLSLVLMCQLMVAHVLLLYRLWSALKIQTTTGISSDLISIKVLNTRSSHNTMEHLSTDTMLIASIIFLVVSMVTCIAVSVMVTTIVLMRNRARIKSILDDFWQINRTLSTATHLEGTYNDVIDASPSVRLSVISTRHNVAYAQKQT